MRLFLLALFFAAFFLPTSGVCQSKEWILEKESATIKVFTREVESTNIKEFKAQAVINSPASKIVEILKDVRNYPLWIEDVRSSRVLSEDPKLNFYYELHLPWPIKNRDVAMAMDITINPDRSTLLKLANIAQQITEYPDFIRITDITGYWFVDPIDEQSCEVTYQFLADPEGFLPAWVINLFIVDGPFKTLENLDSYASSKDK